MVDKTRRKPRKQAANDAAVNSPYPELLVSLPAFAGLVLRRRAEDRKQTVADVIEALLWEDCYVDELQTVAQESDYAGLAFMDWFQRAVARRK